MNRRHLLLLAHAAALWPVGRWYVVRVTEGAGDLGGLAALGAAVALSAFAAPRARDRPLRLLLPCALLAASAASWAFAPPLVAAALGVTSLVALVSEVRFGTRMEGPLLGLALLALPSLSSLQFFVGWPFRVAVAAVAAPLLGVVGIDTVREGTTLVVVGRAVAVDAPCSGVWMLWGALLLVLGVAMLRRLTLRATAAGLAALLPLVFAANLLRTIGVTLIESRPGLPRWTHDAVGVVALAAAAAAVVLLTERTSRCAPRCST